MVSHASRVLDTVQEMAEPAASLAHKTAIARNQASVPVRWLNSKGLLRGRILDYGCGKGDIVRFLNPPGAEQYDPYFHPEQPQGVFDTVYCGYVFNVIPREHHKTLLRTLWRYLAPGGKAYITVRRDIQKSLGQEGTTKSGTEQYDVHLPLHTVAHKKNAFEIYVMRKGGQRAEP
jgi:ubiquinone/menaquinone biosynthesis C-methylase UbiE